MSTKVPEFERSPHTSIRIASEEKARFRAAAGVDGCRSLSTWLKHLARRRVAELVQSGKLPSNFLEQDSEQARSE